MEKWHESGATSPAVGSPDTVVTVTGTGFDSACRGLVDGLASC